MSNAAFFDTSANAAYVTLNLSSPLPKLYVGFQLYRTAAQLTAQDPIAGEPLRMEGDFGDTQAWAIVNGSRIEGGWDYDTGFGALTTDTWHSLEMLWEPGVTPTQVAFDGAAGVDNLPAVVGENVMDILLGWLTNAAAAGQGLYVGHVWVGSDSGLHDVLLEDWSGGTFASWSSTFGACSIVTAPVAPPAFTPALAGPAPPPATVGRVLIALDDGPLVASPTWTRIDDTDNLVAGVDIHRGRQSEQEQTDTGTMTVYLNDTQGLFDPANTLSPYFGKVDGKQILCQVYDPTTLTWEPQFRGLIDNATFDVSPSQVVTNVQLECVDIFDYLAGLQMVPGRFGDTPPRGSEGIVFYEDTTGTVDDRIIQALTDAGIDSTRYVVFTGNVSVQETKYDPGDSVLTVLRDAADAEAPFIANIYTDRQGRFVFHGRESRFDPDTVAATTTTDIWDFTRWKAGDGAAIALDATRAQIRVLAFSEGRRDVVNAALAWPQGLPQKQVPDNIYVDATSITAYGYHPLPPLENLVIKAGTTTGNTAKVECAKYAELYVKNMKDPVTRVQTLTLKSLAPTDPRAAVTWPLLTKADISDILNLKVGYPGGTGIDNKDYYIEGITKRIRPLNPGYDLVETDFDVSPAVWSMDTHGVFA